MLNHHPVSFTLTPKQSKHKLYSFSEEREYKIMSATLIFCFVDILLRNIHQRLNKGL